MLIFAYSQKPSIIDAHILASLTSHRENPVARGTHTILSFGSKILFSWACGPTPMCLWRLSSCVSISIFVPTQHIGVCTYPFIFLSGLRKFFISLYVENQTFLSDLRFHHGPAPEALCYHSNPSGFELKFSLLTGGKAIGFRHTSTFPAVLTLLLLSLWHVNTLRTYFLWY